jgi:hypothetical protein
MRQRSHFEDSIGTTFVSFLAETTATDKDNTYLAKIARHPDDRG